MKPKQPTQPTQPTLQQPQQPSLTAKSWLLMTTTPTKYCRGSNTMQKLEIASLTKMYTLQACLELNNQYNIKPGLCWVQVMQSCQCGTQAGLVIGKYLRIEDLYYGLMLPSGNDAALNLGYYYGYFMGRKEKFPDFQWRNQKNVTIQGKKKYNKIYLTRFISYMNEILIKQKLNHTNTHFQNPHGLSDKLHKSTAWQLANATIYFLTNPKFSTIVQTQSYTATYSDGQTQQWQNTNVLLKEGYIGVKTGWTTTAGSCLCSRKVVYYNKKKYDFVLVVLGCRSQEDRFVETKAIIEDFVGYLKMMGN